MPDQRCEKRTTEASDRERLAGALVRLEAWARQRGLEDAAAMLAPAIDRLDQQLTSS